MRRIHEKLYRLQSLSKIDFQDYTQSFISDLHTSFGSLSIHCEITRPDAGTNARRTSLGGRYQRDHSGGTRLTLIFSLGNGRNTHA